MRLALALVQATIKQWQGSFKRHTFNLSVLHLIVLLNSSLFPARLASRQVFRGLVTAFIGASAVQWDETAFGDEFGATWHNSSRTRCYCGSGLGDLSQLGPGLG